MQGGKNRILPKEMRANRFFWDSHWLEIWSNHFCPSMGPNGGSVAMDSVHGVIDLRKDLQASDLLASKRENLAVQNIIHSFVSCLAAFLDPVRNGDEHS